MAGFLQGLGQAYGRNLIVGQEMAEKQSLIDQRNTSIAEQKQQMAMLARQQKTQEDVGQFVSSEMQRDANTINDPVATSKMYEKAAGIALRDGDFKSADTMNQLAQSKLKEAKEAAVYQAQQLQVKKEDLANAADTLTANPTQENYQDLVKKAAAAGVNPTTIPTPGTPEFATWINQQKMASMTAKEKAEFTQKAKDQDERREQARLNHEDNVDLRRSQMAQTGMLREAMIGVARANLGIREEEVGIRARELKLKEDAAASGGKQGVQQQRDTAAIAGAAAEGARNLRQISNFQIGTVGSPFQNLSDHGLLDAVAKAGTNALTPETFQMFQTAGAGLAQQVGRVETLGGGRGVNQTQINQLEKQLTPVAGDHPLTQLYKVSTGAELLLTRMENTPPPRDPSLKAAWDKTIADLQKYPKPEDVLAKAQGKTKKDIINLEGSYSDNLAKIHANAENAVVPSAAPAGASVPGLPQGWSVKEK